MRIFYLFNIKKEVYEIYKDTPSVIYNLLKNIYYSKRDSYDYSNIIFKDITESFNKDKLDLFIYIKLHNMLRYSKRGEEHIINNLYKDEISIMKVKKCYIIINSNKKLNEFFGIINSLYDDCIACDFINQDFFYLQNIKRLV